MGLQPVESMQAAACDKQPASAISTRRHKGLAQTKAMFQDSPSGSSLRAKYPHLPDDAILEMYPADDQPEEFDSSQSDGWRLEPDMSNAWCVKIVVAAAVKAQTHSDHPSPIDSQLLTILMCCSSSFSLLLQQRHAVREWWLRAAEAACRTSGRSWPA